MSGSQLRLLLLSLAAVVLIVIGAIFTDWFVVRGTERTTFIDMRSDVGGTYDAVAALAFWTSLLLFVLVATQAGSRLLSDVAYPALAIAGSIVGAIAFVTTAIAGYITPPALDGIERASGPLALLLGTLAGTLAILDASRSPHVADELAAVPEERRIPATPIGIAKQPTPAQPTPAQPMRAKVPTQPPMPRHTPPSVARTTSPTDIRSKAPTTPPAIARTTSPTDVRSKPATTPPAIARTTSPSAGLELPPRAHSSSSGPIDVAARLGGGALGAVEVAIRPPPPEPPVIPEDQIAVDPAAGLVIRKRSPSAAPPPSPLAGKVKYAVTIAAFGSAGITATREDGLSKLITWDAIVGIVARRMPQHAPYNGTTFVDIVSAAGATMRILPATLITGHSIDGDETERARALVNLLAAQSLEAKLDSATRVFANGSGRAAQLREEKSLAIHDERLA